MDQSEQQRVAFEAKMAFLERSVELMNETILEQGRSIDGLIRRLEKLESDQQGDDGDDVAPHDSPPPHY